MVVGVAGLVAGAVGIASASSGRPVGPDITGARTFVASARVASAEVIDLGRKGSSQGDLRIANGPVYRGGKRVGHVEVVCTQTGATGRRGRVYAQCLATWTLSGAEITLQTAQVRRSLGNPRIVDRQAVTGGTGRFRNVRGQADVSYVHGRYVATFKLIP